MADLESRVDKLERKVDALDYKISVLEGKVDNLSQKLGYFITESRLAQSRHERELDNIKNKVSGLYDFIYHVVVSLILAAIFVAAVVSK